MSVASDDRQEEQRPQQQTLCQSFRRDAHIKCLVLTLLIMGCLAALAWCRLAEVTRLVVNFQSFPITSRRRGSPCDEGYVYIPIAFMVMLYLVYLVECWHCSTRLELMYKVDASAVYEHIQHMREAQPMIWWKAICYHYVRRTRQVTRYRNGDAYTTTQIYYERINSHAAGSCFVYTNCGARDISKKLVDLEKHPATKIRFSKGFAFANLEAANEFEEQRMRFFQDNERMDDYMEMREGLDLVGVNFQEYMVAFADPDQLPWYVSHMVFWLFSLVLFSWPLRVLIEFKTAYVHYQVTKLFGVNYLTPSSGTLVPGRLSRGSTVDSSEMERHIANDFTLAPSYSEALLFDSNGNIPNAICLTDSTLNVVVTPTAATGPENYGTMDPWPGRRLANHRPPGSGGGGGRTGLPVSVSRSSLPNGQVVYYVSPLSPTGERTPNHSLRRTFTCPRCTAILHEDNPPNYEDALRVSRPLFLPLRRSVTDRDLNTRCHRQLDQRRTSGIERLSSPLTAETEL